MGFRAGASYRFASPGKILFKLRFRFLAVFTSGFKKTVFCSFNIPMKHILLALLIWLPFISFCQSSDSIVVKFGKRDSLVSKLLKEKRPYWVYLPASYNDKSIQPMRYPVLYILDGDIHFKSISSMVEILGSGTNGVHVIPEMIIVSILNTDRTRDMTPTHSIKGVDGKDWDYLQTSGGGDNFLNFIKDELIPKVDSTYRTGPYRIFVGHSFGGLTVINALITMPKVFNAYIAIDPSLWWDNQLLLNQAKDFFWKTDLKSKYLFVAQANSFFAEDTRVNAHFEAIKNFATTLEIQRHHSGLNWRYKYYGDDNHGSVAFVAEYYALRFIFEDYFASFDKIKSAAELKNHYQAFSNETKVNFLPPEKVVNEFANIPLFFNKYDAAQDYYQLNIENFPKSPGAYKKMAKLWLDKGDKKKALGYFEQSLKLNPENLQLKEQVQKIKEEINTKK